MLAIVSLALVSCDDKKKKNTIPDGWPWPTPVASDSTDKPSTPTDPVEQTSEWTDVSSDYGTLPGYVKILKAPSKLADKNAVAFIADVDLSQQSFSVWSINAPDLNGSDEPLLTPMQVYNAQDKPSVVINAGFFYTDSGRSYSSSLAVSEGKLLSPNINYASQDWVTMYYPTRAVFLEHADGSYEAAWTYWRDASQHWIYQEPAANSWSKSPLKAPNASTPSAGKAFEAVNGIGGGPVLLKGGEIRNTFVEELFDGPSGIMCEGSHPRTAIGITGEKHLVLFVCEGRNMTEGVPGYTTEEVALILKDYGCTDAINLDGGGSTLMLVNGTELIKPSDGKERKVASCIYIK